MGSAIREPTERESDLATTVSGEAVGAKSLILSQIEDKGFRTIKYDYQKESLSILIPSRSVLEWDLNPRSLDSLKSKVNELELKEAAVYLGMVYSSICSIDTN